MTFKVNKIYQMKSPGDQDCVWQYEVIKRTAKSVTLREIGENAQKTFRFTKYCECEGVFPLGQYSMAPILKATNEVN